MLIGLAQITPRPPNMYSWLTGWWYGSFYPSTPASLYTSNIRYWPNTETMLGQHPRRWSSYGSPLGSCIVFAVYPVPPLLSEYQALVGKHYTLTQYCFNAGPTPKTFVRNWNNFLLMSCECHLLVSTSTLCVKEGGVYRWGVNAKARLMTAEFVSTGMK